MPAPHAPSTVVAEVELRCAEARLPGELALPESPTGLVLLAAGRAGMRRRDEAVARTLHLHGWGTLLLGLLPRADAALDPFAPVDTATLARRIVCAVDWLTKGPATAHLPVVLLGVGEDTGAVLAAAASRPDQVETVVLLGADGDLNVPVEWVRAPVLLVLATDEARGRTEQEQLARRLCVPFRVTTIESADPHLTDSDARERAVDVVTRMLRQPTAFRSAPAGGVPT